MKKSFESALNKNQEIWINPVSNCVDLLLLLRRWMKNQKDKLSANHPEREKQLNTNKSSEGQFAYPIFFLRYRENITLLAGKNV